MRLLGTGLNPVHRAPGLMLWLRGDRGITQSSGSVSAWADQSLSGFNLTDVSSTKPTYVSNALNGIPGVQFVAASSTWLGRRTNSACFTTAFTIVMVCKVGTTSTAWLMSHGVGNIAGIGFEKDGGPNWRVQGQGVASWGDGATDTNFHVFSTRSPSVNTSPDLRIDGTSVFSQTTPGGAQWSQPDQSGSVTAWVAEINLGGQDSVDGGTYSNFADCTWCEFIIYNNQIANAQLTYIEHYLKAKYAL